MIRTKLILSLTIVAALTGCATNPPPKTAATKKKIHYHYAPAMTGSNVRRLVPDEEPEQDPSIITIQHGDMNRLGGEGTGNRGG